MTAVEESSGLRGLSMNETQLAENEETARQAMLYTVSYLYENRNTADYHALTLTLRALLFAQREGVV